MNRPDDVCHQGGFANLVSFKMLQYRDLNPSEIQELQKQQDYCLAFIRKYIQVDRVDEMTLEMLDVAWGKWLSEQPNSIELIKATVRAIGIRFGQIIVERSDFKWVFGEDEYGSDLAILALPEKGDVIVYPADFVAKRWDARVTNFMEKSIEDILETRNQVEVMHKNSEKPWWKFW